MKDLRLAPLRVLWVTLPFVLGPLLGAALHPRVTALRTGGAIALWIVWAAVLVAVLIPRVQTLTFVRVVAPGALAAATWAAFADELDGRAAVGLAAALAVTIAALVAPTGDAFVNGSSYGDERRMPLRPPGLLLLGPIELAWAAAVAGFVAGPMLLATEQWVAGVIVTVVGLPIAVLAVRALHPLARRWLVFVPAGFVIHDHLALAEPVLFRRAELTAFAIAPADPAATDLTAGSLGPALRAAFEAPVAITPVAPSARRSEPVDPRDVTAVLFAPTRPGAALTEAARRRFPTAPSPVV
jgi:hypothetical protein